ncbi:MAG: nucleotide exchange factor GrpE [Gallionellaceae bacterium]|jgi:molecular chaperone GrpE|nr:nucleotide exchange factor GrpE [Gallionellaceae bacterium]
MEQNQTAPAQENPVTEGIAPEVTSTPEELLQAAELKAQEHHEALMYAKAEAENIRRRAQDDISKAQKFAVERFSNELLAVMDSLDAALSTQTDNVEGYKSGMELTRKQLGSAFEKFNITEINPIGEKFDAHKHQAIGMVESEQAPNTVVSVMQKGYTLHDRVLRPALVTVAKGN